MSVYETHEDCKTPTDESAIIWRYVDLSRFVSILQRKALFFTTIRLLKLRDPYEGVLTEPTKTFPITPTSDDEIKFTETGYLAPSQIFLNQYNHEVLAPITENFVAVNCWHLNDFESAAMWQLNANYNEGIAIRSSYKRLRDSFLETNKTPRSSNGDIVKVSIGEIEYIDYRKDRNNFGNVMTRALSKRRSFEHERELRAICLLPWHNDPLEIDTLIPKSVAKDFTTYSGVYFPVDLNNLIEEVFIAPSAMGWFKEIVNSIMKKYKLDVPLTQSDLLKDIS